MAYKRDWFHYEMLTWNIFPWYEFQNYWFKIAVASPRGQCLKWIWSETFGISKWVRSWRYGCIFTWFCYQLITNPSEKTAPPPWPDSYATWWAAFETVQFTTWAECYSLGSQPTSNKSACVSGDTVAEADQVVPASAVELDPLKASAVPLPAETDTESRS